MKSIACLVPLLALIVAAPDRAVASEVFRCEIDGVVTFSDQPCGDDAQPYVPAHGISVVEPSADLEEIAEQNRAYIEQWHARREAQREQHRERAGQEASQVQPIGIRQTPTLYPDFPTTPPPEPPADETNGGDTGSGDQRERFSALSGPFPGTRRDRNR